MRARLLCAAGLVLLAGCRALTRPEGNGGWPTETRRRELDERSAAAGTAFGPRTTVATPADDALAAGPLTLPTVLKLAADNNRRIRLAGNDTELAAGRVGEARALLLPATTAAGRYTWYTDALSNRLVLPPGILPAGSVVPPITIRERDFGTVNAVSALPLDLSGEFRAALRAAQAGYRGEQAKEWAVTLQQQLEVVRAYFDLLETQRLRDVTTQTISLDREQASIAEARFASGRATKNDLLIAQVALQNAEQELVRRDLAIAEARWRLNQTMGARIDADTSVVDVRERPDLPQVDEALRQAYEHNPVLRGLLEDQQRVAAQLQSLQRSRLPRFQAGLAGDYSSSGITEPKQFGSAFSGFTWDLGTDLRRESQVAQARTSLDNTRLRLEQQLRELEMGIRTVHKVVLERLSALRSAETAVSQAEENLRIRRQQFDAGRAQSDDVLRAEAVLAQQRATLATALYQAHTRRAELQQLIGLPLDSLAQPSK